MKLTSNILVAITVLLSFTSCNAQIKNATTETVKIYGNCGMCEKTIEKAGNLKDIAKIDWNVDTKMATITYDTKKTNQDEILRRIALSGYDSDKFLAPDDVYNNLHGCCQYDRVAKVPVNTNVNTESQTNYEKQTETPKTEIQNLNQLKVVFDNYFALKDELVKTDGNTASAKAATLLLTINRVEMQTLKTEEHNVWMRIVKNIKEDAEHISDTKNIKHQREHFVTLSKNIYDLIKVSKQETPTYYQFCPMANNGKGANWLSKENTVKNPYYGSMMLNCGKVIETIK
jgi:copper chaperone CopZ